MIGRRGLLAGGPALLMMATPAMAAKPDTLVPDPKVAWILLGMTPDNARITIRKAIIKDDIVVRTGSWDMKLRGPVDGFMMLKAKPDEIYAIDFAAMMFGKSIFGDSFNPCGKIMTFRAEGGKVIYFGDLVFERESTGLRTRGRRDVGAARTFVQSHYPGLADSLEEGRSKQMAYAAGCD